MWGSKARSGYGDSTIGGDYDSWDNISPNGRQYKNEITQETRDLSGSDYWHLRKQNRPTEEIPEHLHMLNKHRANIEAYADKRVQVKPKSSVSIQDKILPQLRTLNKRIAEIIELESEYKTGNISIQDYTVLRGVAFQKRDRAEALYKLAINKGNARNQSAVDSVESDVQNDGQASSTPQQEIVTNTFLDELSPHNSLKLILQKALQGYRVLVVFSQQAKAYIQTLKAV